VVALDLPARFAADHVTAAGETARVSLPDGSTAWLNTDSALRVAFDGARRLIRLLEGEALFEVAHDPARRFAVLAHDGLSTALGTRFAVLRAACLKAETAFKLNAALTS
jgi:transmembrane sensor